MHVNQGVRECGCTPRAVSGLDITARFPIYFSACFFPFFLNAYLYSILSGFPLFSYNAAPHSHIFLPPLLFESAFDLNIQILRKEMLPVLVLAFPGLMVATLMTGAFAYWRFSNEGKISSLYAKAYSYSKFLVPEKN